MITNTDDMIRVEDIQAECDTLCEALLDKYNEERHEDAQVDADDEAFLENMRAAAKLGLEEAKWFLTLRELLDDVSGCEELISDDYFMQYTRDLIDDCYELPKEFHSGAFPYRHMSIDYEAAADDLKGDYTEVGFDGNTYWAR